MRWIQTGLVVLFLAATSSTASTADRQAATVQETNDKFVAQVLAQIGDKRTQPAGAVFKNMQLENLKDEPAATLLDIMSYGYSKALGVTCTHCHDVADFSSDAKRPKNAAREMAVMHHEINQTLLKMKNLAGEGTARYINCATCHRGHVDPH